MQEKCNTFPAVYFCTSSPCSTQLCCLGLFSSFAVDDFTTRKVSLMQLSHKAAFRLALLTGAIFIAPAVSAQQLELGQYSSTTLSGTATLTDTGTTANGTYNYYDFGEGVALANQNSYSEWLAYGSSTANVKGGSIDNLSISDTSTANVTGGTIDNNFSTSGTSTANVTGGSIFTFVTYDTSTANVGGGIFYFLVSAGASTANVSGGSITALKTNDASTANVTGGTVTNSLSTSNTSILDLFGTGFTETPLPSNGLYPQYTVTGILQNGDSLNATYSYFGGTLEFNGVPAQPVPEASSLASFSLLLLLGLGGVAVSRRRKAGATR